MSRRRTGCARTGGMVQTGHLAGLTGAAVVIPKAKACTQRLPDCRLRSGSTRPGADGDLRGAGDVPPAERQHDDDDRHLVSRRAGRGGSWGASGIAPDRLRVTLTFLVGVILVAASLLRLGFVANFISEPVLTGFKAGIGVVIVLDQMPKLLGLHFLKGSFFHNLWAVATGLPDTSIATAAVGAATIAILVAMERFSPRAPAPLIAVAAGIAGVSLLGLQAPGCRAVRRRRARRGPT